jgi:hypothetical protein
MINRVNKAKLRRDISNRLYEVFVESKVEYTCLASVFGVVRPQALIEAKKLLERGINLSKSNYTFAFVGNMADMFTMDAAKLAHEEWRKKYYGESCTA